MKLLWNGAGGFIRCELNEFSRLHVYCPDLFPSTVDEQSGSIHDHRFIMSSRVLFGGLRHHVYDVKPSEYGDHVVWEVVNDEFYFVERVTLSHKGITVLEKGDDYKFGGTGWFHYVEAIGPTMTCVTRIAEEPNGIHIITRNDQQPKNAFDPNRSPTEQQMTAVVESAFSRAITNS